MEYSGFSTRRANPVLEIWASTWYFSPEVLTHLAPGRPGCHCKTAIFNLVLLIGIFTSSKDNALRWMPRDLSNDKSTLVQVMAWCRQATSHYLSQCWPGSMSPYGITRPQWVKSLTPRRFKWNFKFHFHTNWLVVEVSCLTDKLTLVQVMACGHQATSHYPSQCWSRSMPPNGMARPQWVKLFLKIWVNPRSFTDKNLCKGLNVNFSVYF